jgi:hypothetical protein
MNSKELLELTDEFQSFYKRQSGSIYNSLIDFSADSSLVIHWGGHTPQNYREFIMATFPYFDKIVLFDSLEDALRNDDEYPSRKSWLFEISKRIAIISDIEPLINDGYVQLLPSLGKYAGLSQYAEYLVSEQIKKLPSEFLVINPHTMEETTDDRAKIAALFDMNHALLAGKIFDIVPLTISQQAINLFKKIYPNTVPRNLSKYIASSTTFNLVMNYFKRVPSYQELIRIKEEISEFEQFEKTLGDKIKEFKISSIKELQQTKHEIEDSVKKDLKALEKEYGELKKRYAISLGMFSVSVISTSLLRDFAHILTAASSTILAHTLMESRVFKNRLKENWVSVFFKLKHKHIL